MNMCFIGLIPPPPQNLSVSTAFCTAWNHITRLELQQHPLNFGEAFAGTPLGNDLLFGMLMLCIDGVLYAVTGYLYGRYFTDEHHFVEVAVRDLPATVGARLHAVTKSYVSAADGGRPALHDVTVEFRRDQITCLLGRNGAGKSTIIKLLTGQTEATAGEVYLPQNVNAITGAARTERVGLCPQSTVLIPNLTAKEHLQLYASIKLQAGDGGAGGGGGGMEQNCEVERIMAGLELGEYEQFRSENLSGGFKRRLNIGIAFIGSPNLVILDEPCSAVDTRARRAIWQTIRVLRHGRAVVMATHHLDEAELLSDQVIVLNEGRVISESGTQALRDQFTRSLCVRIEVAAARTAEVVAAVRAVVLECNGGGGNDDVLVEHQADGLDVTVSRYTTAGAYANMAPLMRTLERLQELRRIAGFRVRNNNLESMFNRLVAGTPVVAAGRSENGHRNNGHAHRISADDDPSTSAKTATATRPPAAPPLPERPYSHWRTAGTLLWKRFVHFRRNYRLMLCVLVLPTVFVAIAMAFMTIRPPGEFDVALPISRQLYASSREFYSLERNSSFDAAVYARLLDARLPEAADAVEFGTSAEAFRWLLNCSEAGATNRYGGISLNGSVAAVWYNNKGYHAMPAYLNELNNALLNAELRPADGDGDGAYRIRTVNRPLQLGVDELSAASVLQKVADAGISIILLVAFSLVAAGSSIYLVNERLSGEKLQQRLAGVGFGMYWGVAFVWDMAVYMTAIGLAVLVMLAFDIPAYTARDNLAGMVMILVMFGVASAPLVHVCEKLFADASLANMHILCMNIIVALTTRTAIILIDLLGESETSAWLRDVLNRAFFVFPQHALADGLVTLCENYILSVVFARYYINTYRSPVTTGLLVPHMISLCGIGVLCAGLNYLLESGVYQRWQQRRSNAGAAAAAGAGGTAAALDRTTSLTKLPASAVRTADALPADVVVAVHQLSKRYGQHQALDGVSFRVRRGECFGLLGANGAGKSTVFAILSGQGYASGGTVRWFDRERGISYCPQSNALNDLLTVAETMRFYGRLRCVQDVEQVSAHLRRMQGGGG